jgi:hypothetical protein
MNRNLIWSYLRGGPGQDRPPPFEAEPASVSLPRSGDIELEAAGAGSGRMFRCLDHPPEFRLRALELVRGREAGCRDALSGGYDRESANSRLALNHGVIASFSRSLTEGLSVAMSDEEFDATLRDAIARIFSASTT